MKTKVETAAAPKALGPYSQGVKSQSKETIYVSGQLPLDPATGLMVEGDIKIMTRQAIKNLEGILIAAGSDLEHVVRVEVFLTDLTQFKAMNEEYALFFNGAIPPARQTVQVAALPLGSPIEISCIAVAR